MGLEILAGDRKTYAYQIDGHDRIVAVSANWGSFAEDNDWTSTDSAAVVGKSLWDFMQGDETKHLYQTLVEKVRIDQAPVTISFRCDSPVERRLFELKITPQPNETICFKTTLNQVEPRKRVPLLQTTSRHTDSILRMCSTCKKVALSDEKWVELETAIEDLRLFENVDQPRVSHGFCPDCYREIMEKLRLPGSDEAGIGSP